MKLRNCLLTWVALFYIPIVFAQPAVPSIEGDWLSRDDKTGEPRAILRLTIENGVLGGKVARIYPQPGDTGICSLCPGEFKDKPILGMAIVWDLSEHSPGSWHGGKILDAKTGTVYRVKMMVKENNPDKLLVRGYVGVSLIGRTQVWERDKNV